MKRWIWGLVLLFTLTIFAGWGMVSLPTLANLSLSIALRQQLYSVIYPKLGLGYKTLPFGIMPMLKAKDEGSYVYTLLGKLITVDDEKQILQIQTKGGVVYGVRYSITPAKKLIYSEKGEAGWSEIEYDQNILQHGEVSFMVQWSDKRELGEILTTAQSDKDNRLVNPKRKLGEYIRVTKLE